MGIRYLKSFVNQVDGLREKYKLHNSKVVIDGKNLLLCLYNQFNRENENDFLHGGNYTNYMPYFKQFFMNLKECKIEPIIVFDDGLNHHLIDNGRKRYEKIFNISKSISELISTKKKNDFILPFLLGDCLDSVIRELDIDSFQTIFDADLAKLANALQCPILSGDSDYLILNVKFGVITFENFQWKTLQELSESTYYINCEFYKIDNFVEKFSGLKPDMLPIFASLMGNDFIDEQIFSDLISGIPHCDMIKEWIYKCTNDRCTNREMVEGRTCKCIYERLDRINRVLFWLSENFADAAHAINHINKYLQSKQRNAIKMFEVSLNSYKKGNNETYLFELYKLKHKTEESENINIEIILDYLKSIDNQIPEWFFIEFVCNSNLKSVLMSILQTKYFYLKLQIEDFSLASCFDCCQNLFEFICGLLRLHKEDSVPTKIVSRKGSKICEIQIIPKVYLNEELEELPLLTDIQNLSPTERKDLFLKLLNSGEQLINYLNDILKERYLGIDEDIEFWIYLVLVIRYWMQNSKIKNNSAFVRALVLCVIYYKYSAKYDENEFSNLSVPKQNSINVNNVHYYSEFQACYAFINVLSSLLEHPIGYCDLHNYLNGVLIYNLFEKTNSSKSVLFKTRKLQSIYWFILRAINMK